MSAFPKAKSQILSSSHLTSSFQATSATDSSRVFHNHHVLSSLQYYSLCNTPFISFISVITICNYSFVYFGEKQPLTAGNWPDSRNWTSCQLAWCSHLGDGALTLTITSQKTNVREGHSVTVMKTKFIILSKHR